MLEHVIKNEVRIRRLRSSVIGPHVDSFTDCLTRLGFAVTTVRPKVSLLEQLNRWMVRRGCGVADLNERVVNTFLQGRRRRARLHRDDGTTVRAFLAHLRAEGVTASRVPVVHDSPLHRLQRDYEQYLMSERGLARATVANNGEYFLRFMTEHAAADPLSLRHLDAATIATFVRRHAPTISPGRAKIMVTALRSIFRFFLQRGLIDRDLAACVPTVPNWRLASIPKFLTPDEIERLLHTCDQTTPVGRRNRAILLLLARLGLRAGEVVTLELADLHWRSGEITVRGKGLRHDRLPLPSDVGEALADYLHQDRPQHPARRVFLLTRAPRRGLAGPGAVCSVVRRALGRAGLRPPVTGAHLLRHSLATGMLRHGASLAEIGQVLRHRAVNTTEIYAKVDVTTLRALAHPWPGAGGAR